MSFSLPKKETGKDVIKHYFKAVLIVTHPYSDRNRTLFLSENSCETGERKVSTIIFLFHKGEKKSEILWLF
jgi:hypothetical protein